MYADLSRKELPLGRHRIQLGMTKGRSETAFTRIKVYLRPGKIVDLNKMKCVPLDPVACALTKDLSLTEKRRKLDYDAVIFSTMTDSYEGSLGLPLDF